MLDNLNELTIDKAQRVADAFSVGKVIGVKKFEDEEIVVPTRLSPKNLKSNTFLAASYANNVPNWLDENRTKDDWNFNELSEELKKIGITKHTDAYYLTSYSLKSTHGQYLLVGISPAGNLSLAGVKKILKSKLKITFVQEIPTSHHSTIYCSHQYDIHWYLFSNIHLTRTQTQEFLSTLIGKPISILIGYGAPILADIGATNSLDEIDGKFFTNEYWWVEQDGKKSTDRWKVPKDFFASDEVLMISDISFDKSHKHTFISLSNGQVIVVKRDEELTTWHFDFPQQKFSIKLTGKGEFIQSDYYSSTPKPKKKTRVKTKKIETVFIENKQISQDVAYKLLSPLLKLEVIEVTEYSGKSFGLELGNLIDEWRYQGLLSIDGEWVLKKSGKVIASSSSHSFHFLQTIINTLLKQRITAVPSAESPVMSLTPNMTIEVSEITKWKQFGLVTLYNRQDDYHVKFDGDAWEYTGPEALLKHQQN